MRPYNIICILYIITILLPVNVTAFCFEDAGNRYGINPTLLESIAKVESNLNPKAMNNNTNGTSDIGLMQINSAWLKSIGANANDLLNDACLNTMTGARILRHCIDRHGYGWEAVGCYNAMSRDKKVIYAWKVFNRLKDAQGKPIKNRLPINGSPQEILKNTFSVQNSGASSLVFRVRDVTEIERGIR